MSRDARQGQGDGAQRAEEGGEAGSRTWCTGEARREGRRRGDDVAGLSSRGQDGKSV